MSTRENSCMMLDKGICKKCTDSPSFGCAELQTAYESGKKEGLGRLSNLTICEFEDGWGRTIYAVWNEKNATEDDMRRDLLLYPDGTDPRIMYVEKRTWDLVFGETKDNLSGSKAGYDDPYAQVKIANSILYYGAQSTVPERGQIVEVIRPSEDCPKGKIWVNLKDRTLRVPFSAIGKILFFSEQDICSRAQGKG